MPDWYTDSFCISRDSTGSTLGCIARGWEHHTLWLRIRAPIVSFISSVTLAHYVRSTVNSRTVVSTCNLVISLYLLSMICLFIYFSCIQEPKQYWSIIVISDFFQDIVILLKQEETFFYQKVQISNANVRHSF